ncbi:MAG: hypothetical protein ACTS80_00465 [Candidatus Hodgkinia cicadicola]
MMEHDGTTGTEVNLLTFPTRNVLILVKFRRNTSQRLVNERWYIEIQSVQS